MIQGISCHRQEQTGKRVSTTESYYFRKAEPFNNHQTFIFFMVYFDRCTRSTENEPFVQFQTITNDDVLANNIRHRLGAYVALGIYSLQEKNDQSSVIFNHSQAAASRLPTAISTDLSGLRYCICLSLRRQQSFYSTGFRAVWNSNLSTTDYCTVELAPTPAKLTVLFRFKIKGKESHFSQHTPRTMLLRESTTKQYKTAALEAVRFCTPVMI